MPETTSTQLPALFDMWRFATDEIERRGLSLADDVTNQLEQFVGQGGAKVLEEIELRRLDPSGREADTMAETARANLIRFIDRLEHEGGGAEIITVSHFKLALRLCPLWPLC
jgi:hypothetical protein